jgi:tetratricopeptide (TPR) repeat protein
MSSARRALELDARSAAAQEALGRAQFLFDWDFAAAERSLARAVELDADYMPAYQAMAWLKSARGQYAEAVAAARRALQLDPVNTARYTELAWVLGLAGRHGEALHELERALQLNPRSFPAYMMKGWAWETAGQPAAAFAAYREGLRLGGVSEESLRNLAAVYRAEGLAGCYRGWLQRGGMPMSDTFRAQMYVRVGELDRAIESLDHAYQRGEGALAWVNVEPSFKALRADPRFQRIAVRVGRRDGLPGRPVHGETGYHLPRISPRASVMQAVGEAEIAISYGRAPRMSSRARPRGLSPRRPSTVCRGNGARSTTTRPSMHCASP